MATDPLSPIKRGEKLSRTATDWQESIVAPVKDIYNEQLTVPEEEEEEEDVNVKVDNMSDDDVLKEAMKADLETFGFGPTEPKKLDITSNNLFLDNYGKEIDKKTIDNIISKPTNTGTIESVRTGFIDKLKGGLYDFAGNVVDETKAARSQVGDDAAEFVGEDVMDNINYGKDKAGDFLDRANKGGKGLLYGIVPEKRPSNIYASINHDSEGRKYKNKLQQEKPDIYNALEMIGIDLQESSELQKNIADIVDNIGLTNTEQMNEVNKLIKKQYRTAHSIGLNYDNGIGTFKENNDKEKQTIYENLKDEDIESVVDTLYNYYTTIETPYNDYLANDAETKRRVDDSADIISETSAYLNKRYEDNLEEKDKLVRDELGFGKKHGSLVLLGTSVGKFLETSPLSATKTKGIILSLTLSKIAQMEGKTQLEIKEKYTEEELLNMSKISYEYSLYDENVIRESTYEIKKNAKKEEEYLNKIPDEDQKIVDNEKTKLDTKRNIILKDSLSLVMDSDIPERKKIERITNINNRNAMYLKSGMHDLSTSTASAKATIRMAYEDIRSGDIFQYTGDEKLLSKDDVDVLNYNKKFKEKLDGLKKRSDEIEGNYNSFYKGFIESDETFSNYQDKRLDDNNYKSLNEAFAYQDKKRGDKGTVSKVFTFNQSIDESARAIRQEALQVNGIALEKAIAVVGNAMSKFSSVFKEGTEMSTAMQLDVFGFQDKKNTDMFGRSTLGGLSEAKHLDELSKGKEFGWLEKAVAYPMDAANEIVEILVPLMVFEAGIKVPTLGKVTGGITKGTEAARGVKAAKTFEQVNAIFGGAKKASAIKNTKGFVANLGKVFTDRSFVGKKIWNTTVDFVENVSMSSQMGRFYDNPYTVGSTDFALDVAFGIMTTAVDAMQIINHLPKGTAERNAGFEEAFTKTMLNLSDVEWKALPQSQKEQLGKAGLDVFSNANTKMKEITTGKAWEKKGQELISRGEEIKSKLKIKEDSLNKDIRTLVEHSNANVAKGLNVRQALKEIMIKRSELKTYINSKEYKVLINEADKLVNNGNNFIRTKGNPVRWDKIVKSYTKNLNDTYQNLRPVSEKVKDFKTYDVDNYINAGIISETYKTIAKEIMDYTEYNIVAQGEFKDLIGEAFTEAVIKESKKQFDDIVSTSPGPSSAYIVQNFVNKNGKAVLSSEDGMIIKKIKNKLTAGNTRDKVITELIEKKLRADTERLRGNIEKADKLTEQFKKEADDTYKMLTKAEDLEKKSTMYGSTKRTKDTPPSKDLGREGFVNIEGVDYRYHIKASFNPQSIKSEAVDKYYLMDKNKYIELISNESLQLSRNFDTVKGVNTADYILEIKDGDTGVWAPEYYNNFFFTRGPSDDLYSMKISTNSNLGTTAKGLGGKQIDLEVSKISDYVEGDTNYNSFKRDPNTNPANKIDDKRYTANKADVWNKDTATIPKEISEPKTFSEYEKTITQPRIVKGTKKGEYDIKNDKITILDSQGKDANGKHIVTTDSQITTLYHESLHAFVKTLDDTETVIFEKAKVLFAEGKTLDYVEEAFIESAAKELTKQGAISLRKRFTDFVDYIIDSSLAKFFNRADNDIDKYDEFLGLYNNRLGKTPKEIADAASNGIIKRMTDAGFNKTNKLKKGLSNKSVSSIMSNYYEELAKSIKESGVSVVIDGETTAGKFNNTYKLTEEDHYYSAIWDRVITNRKDVYNKDLLYKKEIGSQILIDIDQTLDTSDYIAGIIEAAEENGALIIYKNTDSRDFLEVKKGAKLKNPNENIFINFKNNKGTKLSNYIIKEANGSLATFNMINRGDPETILINILNKSNAYIPDDVYNFLVKKDPTIPSVERYKIFGGSVGKDIDMIIKNKTPEELLTEGIGLTELLSKNQEEIHTVINTLDEYGVKVNTKVHNPMVENFYSIQSAADSDAYIKDMMSKYVEGFDNTKPVSEAINELVSNISVGERASKSVAATAVITGNIKASLKELESRFSMQYAKTKGAALRTRTVIDGGLETVENVVGHLSQFEKKIGITTDKFSIDSKNFLKVLDKSRVQEFSKRDEEGINMLDTWLGKFSLKNKKDYFGLKVSDGRNQYIAIDKNWFVGIHMDEAMKQHNIDLKSIYNNKVGKGGDNLLSLYAYIKANGMDKINSETLPTLSREEFIKVWTETKNAGDNVLKEHMDSMAPLINELIGEGDVSGVASLLYNPNSATNKKFMTKAPKYTTKVNSDNPIIYFKKDAKTYVEKDGIVFADSLFEELDGGSNLEGDLYDQLGSVFGGELPGTVKINGIGDGMTLKGISTRGGWEKTLEKFMGNPIKNSEILVKHLTPYQVGYPNSLMSYFSTNINGQDIKKIFSKLENTNKKIYGYDLLTDAEFKAVSIYRENISQLLKLAHEKKHIRMTVLDSVWKDFGKANPGSFDISKIPFSQYATGGTKGKKQKLKFTWQALGNIFDDELKRVLGSKLDEATKGKNSLFNKESVIEGFEKIKRGDVNGGIDFIMKNIPQDIRAEITSMGDTRTNKKNLLTSIKNKISGHTEVYGYTTAGVGIGLFEKRKLQEAFKGVINKGDEYIMVSRKDNPQFKDFISGDKVIFYRNPVADIKGVGYEKIIFIDDLETLDPKLYSIYKNDGDVIHITNGIKKNVSGDFDGDPYNIITNISKDKDAKRLFERYVASDLYKNFKVVEVEKSIGNVIDGNSAIDERILGKANLGIFSLHTKSNSLLDDIMSGLGKKQNDLYAAINRYEKIASSAEINYAADSVNIGSPLSLVGLKYSLFGMLAKYSDTSLPIAVKLKIEKLDAMTNALSTMTKENGQDVIANILKDRENFEIGMYRDVLGFNGDKEIRKAIKDGDRGASDIGKYIGKNGDLSTKEEDIVKSIGLIEGLLGGKDISVVGRPELSIVKETMYGDVTTNILTSVFQEVNSILDELLLYNFVGGKGSHHDLVNVKGMLAKQGLIKTTETDTKFYLKSMRDYTSIESTEFSNKLLKFIGDFKSKGNITEDSIMYKRMLGSILTINNTSGIKLPKEFYDKLLTNKYNKEMLAEFGLAKELNLKVDLEGLGIQTSKLDKELKNISNNITYTKGLSSNHNTKPTLKLKKNGKEIYTRASDGASVALGRGGGGTNSIKRVEDRGYSKNQGFEDILKEMDVDYNNIKNNELDEKIIEFKKTDVQNKDIENLSNKTIKTKETTTVKQEKEINDPCNIPLPPI